MDRPGPPLDALECILGGHASLAIAVSGGVDSMTLAHAAHGLLPSGKVQVFHAASPAVPQAATQRVRDHAQRFGWALTVLNAGEFSDPDYLRNPVDRCYFCKSNLYGRIRERTGETIASGANLDDLSDYRPGLLAAQERDVLHPFVDAGFHKVDVRRLARRFGLSDISDLPAQPCMASRIETGLRVEPGDLRLVETLEAELCDMAPSSTIRCRIVKGGVRLEMSGDFGSEDLKAAMVDRAEAKCVEAGKTLLEVTAYRRGSAFLHEA